MIEGRRCFAVDDGVAAALADRGGVAARRRGSRLRGRAGLGRLWLKLGAKDENPSGATQQVGDDGRFHSILGLAGMAPRVVFRPVVRVFVWGAADTARSQRVSAAIAPGFGGRPRPPSFYLSSTYLEVKSASRSIASCSKGGVFA